MSFYILDARFGVVNEWFGARPGRKSGGAIICFEAASASRLKAKVAPGRGPTKPHQMETPTKRGERRAKNIKVTLLPGRRGASARYRAWHGSPGCRSSDETAGRWLHQAHQD